MSKRLYYIFFLSFFNCNLYAQVKIITRTDSLFFVGIDNEVLITSSKISFEKLSIIVSGGSISGKKGKYIFRCSAPGANASIKVFYLHKLIAEKKMQAVRISDPVVYVAGDTLINEGLISRKQLLTFDSLIVKTNVPYLSISVLQFQFKRISNANLIDFLQNYGHLFSPEIKKVFKKTAKGDTLTFSNVFTTGPDNSSLIHPVIKLTISD